MNKIKILEGELSNSNSHLVRKSLKSQIDAHHTLLQLVRKSLKVQIDYHHTIIGIDRRIIEDQTKYNRCIEKQD